MIVLDPVWQTFKDGRTPRNLIGSCSFRPRYYLGTIQDQDLWTPKHLFKCHPLKYIRYTSDKSLTLPAHSAVGGVFTSIAAVYRRQVVSPLCYTDLFLGPGSSRAQCTSATTGCKTTCQPAVLCSSIRYGCLSNRLLKRQQSRRLSNFSPKLPGSSIAVLCLNLRHVLLTVCTLQQRYVPNGRPLTCQPVTHLE